MIKLDNLTLRRGTQVLLENVNCTFQPQSRTGFVGANGVGKTSLFALICQEITPDKGDIFLPKKLVFAHVAQETPASNQTALDYVLDGDTAFRKLQARIVQAEEKGDGHQIANLYEEFGFIDGYTAPARAAQLLSGLGFSNAEIEKSVAEFSGGWRVRLNLAQALMQPSDILLLDEPTNHLDLDAVLWLEAWLQNYRGMLLLISHDREFLDKIITSVAYVANQQIKIYSGNYSHFEKLHAEELALQQASYEKQQKAIAHMHSFVDRFRYKASKAKQAQSRLKAIEKLEVIAAVQSHSPFQFQFPTPDYCPNPILTIEHAHIAYGDHTVLRDVSFSISPKMRITILGPNGAGKSSLIKFLAGTLECEGLRQVSPGTRIGYFAQHQIDQLHLDDSALLHLRRLAPKETELDLRKHLGSFGFSNTRVFEPVGNFSGGEKSRLALALLIWQKPNLLLLDEPTNHLDIEMRNALSIALQDYEGAMILITHDRFLVRTTTDQLWLAANQCVEPFTGDLDDYQQWLIDFRKQQQSPKKSAALAATPRREKPRVNVLQRINTLEKRIAETEQQLQTVHVKLAAGTIYEAANRELLSETLNQQKKLQTSLQQLEEEWLQLSAEDKK